MLLSHFVAALSAFVRSVQYAGVLSISRAERVRYVKKSVRLALCFAGFGTSWNLVEAWKAGQAGFFCCAYDVVTDWRHFDEEERSSLERILNDFSQPELRHMAWALYDKESNDRLEDDGLERGAISLRFILKMMGCETQREATWGDLDDLGQLLQIVDDVYDYEDDVAAGEQNCLRTPNKDVYLGRLFEGLSDERTHKLFGRARSVLVLAIAHARKKGEKLLATAPTDRGSEFPRNHSI
jgi:hypothetical protein